MDRSAVDGRALVRAYLDDVFSRGNLSAMDRYLRGGPFMERVAELVTLWRTAFSDVHVTVDEAIVEADRVVTVEIMDATHDGVFKSRLGPIAPTGTKVSWSRSSIRRLDGDRFVDGFFEEDEVALLFQLGALAGRAQGSKGLHSPMATDRPAHD